MRLLLICLSPQTNPTALHHNMAEKDFKPALIIVDVQYDFCDPVSTNDILEIEDTDRINCRKERFLLKMVQRSYLSSTSC